MDYVVNSNRCFVTSDITKIVKSKPSEESRRIREFFEAHELEVDLDPKTGKVTSYVDGVAVD